MSGTFKNKTSFWVFKTRCFWEKNQLNQRYYSHIGNVLINLNIWIKRAQQTIYFINHLRPKGWLKVKSTSSSSLAANSEKDPYGSLYVLIYMRTVKGQKNQITLNVLQVYTLTCLWAVYKAFYPYKNQAQFWTLDLLLLDPYGPSPLASSTSSLLFLLLLLFFVLLLLYLVIDFLLLVLFLLPSSSSSSGWMHVCEDFAAQ